MVVRCHGAGWAVAGTRPADLHSRRPPHRCRTGAANAAFPQGVSRRSGRARQDTSEVRRSAACPRLWAAVEHHRLSSSPASRTREEGALARAAPIALADTAPVYRAHRGRGTAGNAWTGRRGGTRRCPRAGTFGQPQATPAPLTFAHDHVDLSGPGRGDRRARSTGRRPTAGAEHRRHRRGIPPLPRRQTLGLVPDRAGRAPSLPGQRGNRRDIFRPAPLLGRGGRTPPVRHPCRPPGELRRPRRGGGPADRHALHRDPCRTAPARAPRPLPRTRPDRRGQPRQHPADRLARGARRGEPAHLRRTAERRADRPGPRRVR